LVEVGVSSGLETGDSGPVSVSGDSVADCRLDSVASEVLPDSEADDVDSDAEADAPVSVSVGSAAAIPGWPTTAAPTPRAAASSPTRPMNRA
jgi:hypothetical protein